MKKAGNPFPHLVKGLDDFKKNILGNAPIDCPLKPRKLYVNITEFMGNEDQYRNPDDLTKDPENGFGIHLPNGKYRFTVTCGSKDDPNAVFVQWLREIHIRLHDDDF
jgi:hypothetical protein